MLNNFSDWKPLQDLVGKTRKMSRTLIENHFKKIIHDESRQAAEISWFLDTLHFITHKWNIDILYQLEIHDGLIFNDIRRHLGNVSARTLSDRLKELQEFHLIDRTVQNSRPLSVMYSLSDHGKGFIELLMVLIFFLSKNRK